MKIEINKSEEFFKLLSTIFAVFIVILVVILIGMIKPASIIDGSNNNSLGKQVEEIKKMSDNPIAVFETSEGNFEIELFLNESPITAGNFKKLVEEGFYDGSRFHRVIKNFMVQGGDPLSKNTTLKNRWGTGGPGYTIEDEFVKGLSNVRGTIAMANSGPSSGGSQFFINVVNNTYLDWDKSPASSKHPVFGKVVNGMNIVDKIVNVKTDSSDRPSQDIIVNKVYIE